MEAMLGCVSSLLLQKENMADERVRCIQLLDVPPAVAGHMDVVLEDALDRATQDLVRSKRDAKLSDKLAQVSEDGGWGGGGGGVGGSFNALLVYHELSTSRMVHYRSTNL